MELEADRPIAFISSPTLFARKEDRERERRERQRIRRMHRRWHQMAAEGGREGRKEGRSGKGNSLTFWVGAHADDGNHATPISAGALQIGRNAS